ncbi:MAG TPA: hypothetical protein DCX14_13870 [Flavobacteriales bacterium]|nr:hypothetical protein [Flavobacteriales bacterium]
MKSEKEASCIHYARMTYKALNTPLDFEQLKRIGLIDFSRFDRDPQGAKKITSLWNQYGFGGYYDFRDCQLPIKDVECLVEGEELELAQTECVNYWVEKLHGRSPDVKTRLEAYQKYRADAYHKASLKSGRIPRINWIPELIFVIDEIDNEFGAYNP